MYTEQDYQAISAQYKSRLSAVCLPAAALLGLAVFCFVRRIIWLGIASTILCGAVCIFCMELFVLPVKHYRRHLDNVLHGRVRSTTGAFKEMEEKAVPREGVKYYPMMLSVGNPDNPEDDRLFYYDANLPRPDWKAGEIITVTAHDKAVGAWSREEKAP